MVRNAMFRRVELACRDRFEELAALDEASAALTEPPRQIVMDAGRLGRGAGRLLRRARHASAPTATRAARSCCRSLASPGEGRCGLARQTLHDPEGDHDWVIEATVDLDASDEAGEPVVVTTALRRL